MNNYKNWPDGATKIVMSADGEMRYSNNLGQIFCFCDGWGTPIKSYLDTIATREPEPVKFDKQTINCRCSVVFNESLSQELSKLETKHLEFMLACYQRGISIDDAEYLWRLK